MKKQRNRASLVCMQCKIKKIKCDRGKPCNNCIKSGNHSVCVYDYIIEKLDDQTKRISQIMTTIKSSSPRSNSIKENNKNDDVNNNSDNNSDNNNNNNNNNNNLRNHVDNEESNSIMDYKFNMIQKYIVFRKPSRTQLRPHFIATYLQQKNSFARQTLMCFKQELNRERKLWKTKNFKLNMNLLDLHYNSTTNNNELTKLINKLVTNNYYAILERLTFFQNELNKVLFNFYIPMGVIQLIFHHYFTIQPNGVIFNGVSKIFEYSFIAVITSIIELVDIFTKIDTEKFKFNFPLKCENNEFNQLTLLLMNSANYRRKASIFSIYTLLNLRLSLMVYGDFQSGGIAGQNSYPLFQTAVSIAHDLGLDLDQNLITYMEKPDVGDNNNKMDEILFAKEVPLESTKLLWNYILMLDSSYTINLTVHPIIDERFTHGIYFTDNHSTNSILENSNDLLNSYVTIVREISLLTMTNGKITFKKFFKSMDNLKNLISRFDKFNNIKEIEKNEDKWIFLKIKFELLKFYMSMIIYIKSYVSDEVIYEIFPNNLINNNKNDEIIKKIRDECDIKCTLIYFVSLNAVVEISKLSNKFVLYNREIFATWFGFESVLFMDIVVNNDMKNKQKIDPNCVNNTTTTLPNIDKFDINKLEKLLYENKINKDNEIIKYVQELSKPDKLATFLTKSYESAIKSSILVSNYTFFVMAKLFLILIYFLYCYIHLKVNSNLEILETFKKLKELTKKIVIIHENPGSLTDKISPDLIMNEINNAQNNVINNINVNPNNKDEIIEPIDFFDDDNLLSIFNEINEFISQPDYSI